MQTVDMPLTPAQIEQLAPLAQQLSVAGHGSKTALKLAAWPFAGQALIRDYGYAAPTGAAGH